MLMNLAHVRSRGLYVLAYRDPGADTLGVNRPGEPAERIG